MNEVGRLLNRQFVYCGALHSENFSKWFSC